MVKMCSIDCMLTLNSILNEEKWWLSIETKNSGKITGEDQVMVSVKEEKLKTN